MANRNIKNIIEVYVDNMLGNNSQLHGDAQSLEVSYKQRTCVNVFVQCLQYLKHKDRPTRTHGLCVSTS